MHHTSEKKTIFSRSYCGQTLKLQISYSKGISSTKGRILIYRLSIAGGEQKIDFILQTQKYFSEPQEALKSINYALERAENKSGGVAAACTRGGGWWIMPKRNLLFPAAKLAGWQ